ncbi:KH domain-containing protein HEN4 isoform X1 [Ricinus communis]|uniref:KH domain-containing protein HEN4 isoform X1 n=1 Tax=Ricinus communis TaxID=3988 RepID=UPI00201A473F|nr:KH domain-containing protein HEN4 isoform X1 [Ricinus communis]XP_015576828.2 KH domain-containing protein HEN4 isoform X1 [Ricinus communis]XP_025013726.2 KH domain-containing protein HEN4 isoform X1 [Ricinus communis]XP_025013727.2 KH domain-containing protein HEN4 isoform X1 [Ricinus communis]XP_025013728.2 KH domain-containing protein HEN4 isoform X1 [Ricinus communis]XP_048227052.1 KH domain-containing protein HEN4 isoform X1 [Ricinus communis]XP_048227054.1 KH domain-containing prote
MAGQRNDYGKRSNAQSDYGGGKRRNPTADDGEDSDHQQQQQQHTITNEDTVYRYLCPLRKIGSIIGRGGEIAKQLRSESKSNIRISEAMAGFEERIVTIYSNSEESNLFGDSGEFVCPAQDALFMVHDRIIAEDLNNSNNNNEEEDDEEEEEFGESKEQVVTVRMLVPADQIGCVIGKGGQVIQSIRSETGAQIRILKDEHLPPLALSSDELLLIIGEPAVVRKALYQVATRLHENPSRSQHLLLSSSSTNMYQSGGGMFVTPTAGASLMGLYGSYKGGWSSSYYSDQRDEGSSKEFSLRLVCPIGNIGGVIGKGGGIIKQIRQESRASIKVDSSAAEGDDCIIFISAKEFFEDQSATLTAALRLQPRCSEKTERDSGDSVITTRLLVPRSQIGCLMGKGGAIISEMRNVTRASIRILAEDNLPKVASEDDEMVQITGSHDVASNALLHVVLRLKANLFGRDGALTAFPPALPYIPVSMDMLDSPKYGNRDSQSRGRGYSSAGGYSSRDLPPSESYGNNASSLNGGESGYGAYGGFSSGRSGGSGIFTRLSGQNSAQRKHHGY